MLGFSLAIHRTFEKGTFPAEWKKCKCSFGVEKTVKCNLQKIIVPYHYSLFVENICITDIQQNGSVLHWKRFNF